VLLMSRLRLDARPRVFDTQVAWALVTAEASVSLAYLVFRVLGLRTTKAHQADDWMRRPLPTNQLAYAACDVAHLPELRARLFEAALRIARAAGYVSAGTVEFLLGADGSFVFLEVNTRLQVEHPVTEAITGLDLVELMIRVAAGERLPLAQKDVRRNGWAIECRINAEDPFRNFLPSSGRVVKFMPPPEIPGQVRVDTGMYEGGEVSMYYDSMIAKLICHGATRDVAIARMREALNAFVIRGVASNIAFQAALMQHPRFVSGDFNTGFIAEAFPKGFHASTAVHEDPLLLAAVAALTGDLSEVRRTIRDSYFADDDRPIDGVPQSRLLHTEKVLLVDRGRHIRGIYNGTDAFEMERLVQDIATLSRQ
jgi:acetyl/propionyl-CoA carboxylase alpha subunit